LQRKRQSAAARRYFGVFIVGAFAFHYAVELRWLIQHWAAPPCRLHRTRSEGWFFRNFNTILLLALQEFKGAAGAAPIAKLELSAFANS
jgi:hypothetical protein